jgi:CRP/FNR family transcriptional regulator, cyclic AMP receptor protein
MARVLLLLAEYVKTREFGPCLKGDNSGLRCSTPSVVFDQPTAVHNPYPNHRKRGHMPMNDKNNSTFIPADFLAQAGLGRRIVELKPKQAFFTQGDQADSVFYLQSGRARLTVVSRNGKEATITLLSAGDFVGEESLASVLGVRLATATAVDICSALKIGRDEMIRVMHEEHALSDLFLSFLLARSMKTQADLVDQLFNSSEKRLARILLLMAEFGKPGERKTFIPPITQETLADMIGTTRSRVSFFMNRFRKLGSIDYNGRIQVHKSLLNVVLLDQLPEHNSEKPPIASVT